MHWPAWLTWYKKPEFRDIKEYSQAVGSGKRPISPDGRSSMIPRHLKVDRVLDNKTCSPMSLFDFYMYLKHIEFSEENLEFYIWHKNYERNYEAASGDKGDVSSLVSSDASLVEKAPGLGLDPEAAEQTVAQIAQLISAGATCTRGSKCKLTCADRIKSSGDDGCKLPAHATSSTATLTNSEAGYRRDLNTIAQTFLVPGAPKELNIPPAMRSKALASIQTSSDPSVLRPVADHVYQLLRNCSHRNFVRLGVSNGTFETVCVATGLGIALTIAGFLAVLLLAFTPYRGVHSGWTVFAVWPMWWLGMSLIMSGLRGSCFFLLLFSRRQPLPWERFTDAEMATTRRTGLLRILSRLMIFDRKFRVKDVHLRQLQRKIVMQSLVGGAAFASCGVLLFIFLPVWYGNM
ncbi:regulator of G protein signaling domain-containing protein [Hirsutella rhossiliensis]|uniref:Regulator of G protein signaling domain-containing protein n=1 Tax=Hirsutella rhossiliensis TaxID=111463 RepID=A0A9P8MX56_9HYPO|nr:regulator of G protein signaling domain-containing protein [Hirsutella rhossiliensis]KAH0962814.1 regulator of G protein signaling domain-containing protein [Hirsutella rhossiliensis]